MAYQGISGFQKCPWSGTVDGVEQPLIASASHHEEEAEEQRNATFQPGDALAQLQVVQ
jgi:hypothetical protein